MIDILTEHVLSMTDGAKVLPSRPHVASMWRYRTAGCHGVKLETILVGGKRFTSREALQRFVERTTAAADATDAGDQALATRTHKQRERDIAAAEEELKESGW